MGLMAMTGGQSVVITDAFVNAGLDVPRLSDASYAELRSFFNIVGGSYQNPLDMGGTIGFGGSAETLARLFGILDADPNVDAIAMEMASGFLARMWAGEPGEPRRAARHAGGAPGRIAEAVRGGAAAAARRGRGAAGADAGAGARHRGVRVVRAGGAGAGAGDRVPPVPRGAGLTNFRFDCSFFFFCALIDFGSADSVVCAA